MRVGNHLENLVRGGNLAGVSQGMKPENVHKMAALTTVKKNQHLQFKLAKGEEQGPRIGSIFTSDLLNCGNSSCLDTWHEKKGCIRVQKLYLLTAHLKLFLPTANPVQTQDQEKKPSDAHVELSIIFSLEDQ